MNRVYKVVFNHALGAWVAVSELTKSHKKRASATAVAVALVAGMLSPFAEASIGASGGGGVNSDNPRDGYNTPRKDDIKGPDDNDLNGLGFGLVVVDKEGKRKEIKEGVKIDDENTLDDDKKSTVITVEPNNDSSEAPPKSGTSYLYLVEGDGVKIDQTGRSAKFSVNTGDGLKVDEHNKVVADTVELTVTNGKVTAPDEENKKKLVNAGGLESALNKLGWKLKAGTTTSTVKSGEEVEFKGEGGVTVTSETDSTGKHIVTIKAAQPQGGTAAGGSTSVTAGDGISVSKGNKVSVKANTDGGITVGADGISVNTKDKGGLTVNGDGVSVNTDGTTIEVDTDGKVTAKVASDKGLEKTTNGLAVKQG
ncbi:TPA: ESPR-type extended signal peptide-containing protein, partial [Neisseria cinerea]